MPDIIVPDPPNKSTDPDLRVGVFVCDCGLNIAGSVDNQAVAEFVQRTGG